MDVYNYYRVLKENRKLRELVREMHNIISGECVSEENMLKTEQLIKELGLKFGIGE